MTNSEKAKNISDAIGELEENIIKEADSERKVSSDNIKITQTKKSNRKKILIPAVSVAACAAIVTGIIFGGTKENPAIFNLPVYAEVLAEAEYPEAYPYPDESKAFNENGVWLSDYWNQLYEPWQEQVRVRNNAKERVNYDALNNFSDLTIKQFLTDSNGGNRVYSPVNLYIALSVLAEIADGNSRQQILKLAGFENIEELRSQAADLWISLYYNDGATTSILANSLWLNLGTEFNSDTINRLANDYFVSVYRGDMASEETLTSIKNWLNKQTDGLLKESADGLQIDPETVLMLCSTISFKAKWDETFDKEKNDIKVFHGLNGENEFEFMNEYIIGHDYYWGDDYGAVRLGFENGYSMWLILPDEGKTNDDILKSGEYIKMINNPRGWENSSNMNINISVPKFDVSSDMDLIDGLKKLGVKDVFDSSRADFSPLFKSASNEGYSGVSVTQVKHAARVVIDEEGCTAAAFTAMLFVGGMLMPGEDIDFILDRPFTFMISSGNSILFAGTVNSL